MKLTEENYVETAEKAIQEICALKNKSGKSVQPVTTSNIRNLLAMAVSDKLIILHRNAII